MAEPIAITSLVISIITTISGAVTAMHLRKSSCLGSECICETEDTKIKRIETIIKKHRNSLSPRKSN